MRDGCFLLLSCGTVYVLLRPEEPLLREAEAELPPEEELLPRDEDEPCEVDGLRPPPLELLPPPRDWAGKGCESREHRASAAAAR